MSRPDSPLGGLLGQLRADPARSWTIADMARTASMSPRTLARCFQQVTGTSPAAWLITQRVAMARDLLETTALPMEHVAGKAGLGSATNLRLHFAAHVGIPPSAYRKQFRQMATTREQAAKA